MLVQLPNNSFAQAVVLTKNFQARERVQSRLERAFQERFPEVIARVYPLEMGMPVGWPVQYRVSGPEPAKVREIAYRVAAPSAENAQLRDVKFDWMERGETLQTRVHQEQARQRTGRSTAASQPR